MKKMNLLLSGVAVVLAVLFFTINNSYATKKSVMSIQNISFETGTCNIDGTCDGTAGLCYYELTSDPSVHGYALKLGGLNPCTVFANGNFVYP